MVNDKKKKFNNKKIPDVTTPIKVRRLCVCESLKPALIICRILGMFPITTSHDQDDNCIFAKNKNWYIYSVFMIIFSFLRTLLATDFFNILDIGRKKSLHPIIYTLNDIMYAFYITILTAMNLYRCPKYVETLNRIAALVKESLYCQSSRRAALTIQYGISFIYILIIFIKFAAIIYVHISESYDTSNFDFKIYSNAIVQSEIFTVYVIFIAMSSVIMGAFGCYEKLAVNCFRFTPIHPLQYVDQTNNSAEFMGLVDYKLCDESHPMLDRVRRMPVAEIIEYLRCLHEEICITIYEMNESLNPQFLAHVVVELSVLILNWYAVIMYMAYVFSNPIARTLHFLNLFFVIVHTLGLLVFLKQAQQLQNLVITNRMSSYHHR